MMILDLLGKVISTLFDRDSVWDKDFEELDPKTQAAIEEEIRAEYRDEPGYCAGDW